MKFCDKRVKLMLGIFLLALVVRLVYFFLFSNENLFGDGQRYFQIAGALFQGGYVDPSVLLSWTPGYPAFLWLITIFFGKNILAMKFIQHLIGAMTAVLVFVLGSKIFNEKVGVVAGVLWAIYGYSVLFADLILTETLFLFFFTLLLIFSSGEINYKKSAIAGLLLGLNVLIRSAAKGFFLIIPIVLYLRKKIDLRKVAVIVIIGLVLTMPYIAYLYSQFNKFIFLDATSEWAFYMFNNPEADQIYNNKLSPETIERIDAISDGRSNENGYILGASYIISNPVKFISDSWIRLVLFFWVETYSLGADTSDKYYDGLSNDPIYVSFGYYTILFFVAVMLLAIPALFYSEPKNRLMLFLFMIYFILLYIVVHAEQRYHIQIMPIVMLFSAFTVVNWKEILGKIKLDRKFAAMAFTYLVLITAWAYGFYLFIILDL
ncbi:MAG: glycosyltransferase family 39 protein [Candidatus Diapherotrites archaeon]